MFFLPTLALNNKTNKFPKTVKEIIKSEGIVNRNIKNVGNAFVVCCWGLNIENKFVVV